MAGKRTYGDSCGIARALDLVGERWALLVVRELLLGPKRFTDLRAGLPNLGPDVLTQRLRELVAAEVVVRRKLDPPAGAWVYELTPRGRELEPIVIALGRWGSLAPFPPGEMRIGVDSTVLALKTLFDPEAATGFDATVELRLDGQRFAATIADAALDVRRGAAEQPDVTIEAAPGALTELLWTDLSLAEAERSGEVRVEGRRAAVTRFLKLFPLPASAG
jgi:DNA-binding HxlR family transcriptional regulator/putative sterol carrier protein